MTPFARAAACAALTGFAFAQSPVAFHFEFDQPGVLPTTTPGIGDFNNTGTPTTAFFNAACGRLVQTTSVNPTLGAGFYHGSFGAYPAMGAGVAPAIDSFIEGRFALTGGTGGSGTIPNATGVMGVYPGANCALIVNVVTADVAVTSNAGLVWAGMPGLASVMRTYHLRTTVLGGTTTIDLFVDGSPLLTGLTAGGVVGFNGFYFGDVSGSHSISADIDWEHVSVGQTPQGVGQPNSAEASLFVNRSNTTPHGQPGLKGPFSDTVPAGSNLTFEWNGPANAPFVLFYGPQNPANSYFGCFGWLDIATPNAYADLTIMFDPFNPYTGFLFWLDGCGKASQSFSVPPWLLPGTPLGNFQGGVFQSSGCPLVLTAAHYVTT